MRNLRKPLTCHPSCLECREAAEEKQLEEAWKSTKHGLG